MNEERMGHSSGWTVEEDPEGSFRWTAFGPAGTLRGQARTRAAAEQAAQEAEQELAAEPAASDTPRVRLTSRSRPSSDATMPEGGSEPQPAPVERLLDQVTAWARQRPDIRGLALVGSWARGAARPDSDLDLVVLTTHPDRYLAGDDWTAALGATRVLRTQAWGPLVERRLLLDGGLELEVGVTQPVWAATDPVDAGTRRVVTDGMRILHDPDGRLAALANAVAGRTG